MGILARVSEDFSHLRRHAVDVTRTAEFTLFQIEGAPVLVLAPANQCNPGYYNAMLRRSRRIAQTGGRITKELVDQSRRDDLELFPQHVVRGWRGVKNAAGADVPFTRENCSAFLRALPEYVFDEISRFAAVAANFVDDAPLDAADEVGKA